MFFSQGKFAIKQESGNYTGNLFRVERDNGNINSMFRNGVSLFQKEDSGVRYGAHKFGGWVYLSDDNLKNNEKPLEKGLEVISKLKPTS